MHSITLGYGPGDEVIVPAQTHIATAHAVELTGAKAVFVDAESKTATSTLVLSKQQSHQGLKRLQSFTIWECLWNAQGSRVSTPYELFVLEDCALAPGAQLDGLHMGLHGDAGVFPFIRSSISPQQKEE